MKKVIAIASLLVILTLVVAAMASAVTATQPDWRFYIKADDGNGSNAMTALQLGVAAGATDGYAIDGTASDTFDGGSQIPSTTSTRGIISVFGAKPYVRDIKSNRAPKDSTYDAGKTITGTLKFGTSLYYEANRKFWDLRVFSLLSNNFEDIIDPDTGEVIGQKQLPPDGNIRLSFMTVAPDGSAGSGAPMPPGFIPGYISGTPQPAKYWLRMINNRGVAGAPTNGTLWSVPIPTAHSLTDAYFTLTLPMKAISAATDSAAMQEGYILRFYQTPEPSSLLALGAGLMGLAGFASRRRRS